MSTTFPRTNKKTPGYDIAQVDRFLATARRAYDALDETTQLTAEDIRHTAFAMHKGGFSPRHVDAALERLEDAFAARARERTARAMGEAAWLEQARANAHVLINRLHRPAGDRFDRVSFLTVGYSRTDVDRFANKLLKYFTEGWPLTVDDVRSAVFSPRRGGYRETQVDVVLDAVVDVMLAVR